MNISAAINGLPICHNQDSRFIEDPLGLITPNLFLIGRNNDRAPEGFVSIEPDPVNAIRDIKKHNEDMLSLLGDFVHRFIPGKRLAEGQAPDVDDVVLFLVKESDRTRNMKYRYGRVIQTSVDGRRNKRSATAV